MLEEVALLSGEYTDIHRGLDAPSIHNSGSFIGHEQGAAVFKANDVRVQPCAVGLA